jgi:UDP-N-acetylglucosamine--N-acetylmuramyl-(pentapeptide) pyrophosphoryl-undecaprenol N-acetylglucosamine transferase
MVELLPPGVEVLWQTGNTDVADLPVDGRRSVPGAEMEEALAKADAVVCHAGIGSALSALEAGRCPILVPRRKAFGENVDDHQGQIAAELSHRGLAIARRPDELAYEDLLSAASVEVGVASDPPPFVLER